MVYTVDRLPEYKHLKAERDKARNALEWMSKARPPYTMLNVFRYMVSRAADMSELEYKAWEAQD